MGKKVDAIITGYPFKQKEQEGVLTLKKFLAVLMVCVAVLQVSPAHSKIMRDVKLGQPCTFDNNAEITLRDFSFVNEIALTENWTLPKLSCARDEEIALLKAEIANLRTNNVTFGKEVALSLAVLYKGKTFYNGFVGQYSFNEPGHLMWRPALSKPHLYRHRSRIF